MSDTLQQRAKAFLKWPVPGELDFVPGSMAEKVITMYAEAGKLPDDGELLDLLQIVVMESQSSAEDRPEGPAKDYLAESAAILTGIADEAFEG
jgi:hypothetical protein